ncbi:Ubiquinone/menaquinone biosynthesis C-methylase UbiE [Thermomonospora echinospora]|uniref:Ubiquinone/menaquinone biosynthesis C-methylase UbiE n=1 Tax=Thermomonospora echinospora TaxID=1992 RepID=A0A1H6E843_9ACTN|nr:methyltransferase domain-containing protein [Thermomonospora echinospora]SEG93892.1 Ubiquinone/menaquinone biosynthesis C-methylase UbiE [Thermomonospora echinospora]
MSEEIAAHYDRLADRYDENWTHSAEFIAWMTSCILGRLDPQPGNRVADIGCGTGLFTRGLVESAGQVACVDPSGAMLERLPEGEGYVPVEASAEDVAEGRVALPYGRLDAILVKEAIHHVRDRARVLAGLAGMLAPGGRVLVVMLPTTIDYPLFDRALRAFEKHQPDPEDIAGHLERAGLQVRLSYESFPLSFSKERYLRMVRNRYMSLLSMFDDAELEAGVAEIDRRHPEEILQFPDRFAFVLGRRT